MTKVICDKCKKEINTKSAFFAVRCNSADETIRYDICNECLAKIIDFITDYEITKTDEYKKGYDDGYADGKEDAWQDQMGDDL